MDRYTTQEQSRALDEKTELINAQIQAVMSAVASMNGPVIPIVEPQPATEFHNVGTPRNSDQQHPPEDAWAQYADAARARASQPTQASSRPAAPPAPAAQSPFVDPVARDIPAASADRAQ